MAGRSAKKRTNFQLEKRERGTCDWNVRQTACVGRKKETSSFAGGATVIVTYIREEEGVCPHTVDQFGNYGRGEDRNSAVRGGEEACPGSRSIRKRRKGGPFDEEGFEGKKKRRSLVPCRADRGREGVLSQFPGGRRLHVHSRKVKGAMTFFRM